MIAQQGVNIENHLAKAHSINKNEKKKHQIALQKFWKAIQRAESESEHLTYLSTLQPTTK